MPTDDYLADYARLGLQPGCSLETLERTWRLAVRELHPDRARDDLDGDTRSHRLHELTSAYRRLRQFSREHGRLPGDMVRMTPAFGPDSETPAPLPPHAAPGFVFGEERESVRPVRWPRRGVALVAGTLALLLGLSVREDDTNEVTGVGHSPADAQHAASLNVTTTPPARLAQRIRLGATEAQVERLLGPPLVAVADLWEYGPSHVRFERGRVVGWYSSPLKPLPVDVESR